MKVLFRVQRKQGLSSESVLKPSPFRARQNTVSAAHALVSRRPATPSDHAEGDSWILRALRLSESVDKRSLVGEMSKANEARERKLEAKLASVSGAAKQQIISSHNDEMLVLFMLGKFGWLTHHQLGGLWGDAKSSDKRAYRVLNRLVLAKMVKSQVMEHSPGSQMKAYYLTRKGLNVALSEPSWRLLIKTSRREITDPRYQYHRMIANQVLLELQRSNLPMPEEMSFINNLDVSWTLPEHEMQGLRRDLNSHFGCIPDGLLMSGRDLLLVEVENSVRGVARHGSKLGEQGNKLESWFPTYFERVLSEGKFAGTFPPFGKRGEYDNVWQIMVCTSEKIFRSIWRKLDKMMSDSADQGNEICYVVMKKPLWVDPLRPSNIRVMIHNDPDTVMAVYAGEMRRRGR